MLQFIKNIFGFGTKTDYRELVKQGAVILDVRSRSEFLAGHIKNSINIPVNELNSNLSKLKDKNRGVICCCASGMRSGAAKRILEAKGYRFVYNGGGWTSLQKKL